MLRAWRPLEKTWWAEVSYRTGAGAAYVRLVPIDGIDGYDGGEPS